MEQITKKHNETGRSMVEMLGVLAVVGVLSIGGVAGYRYAVDKMNANEIINELKKRAITASQQRVLGQDINLKEYYPNTDVDMIRRVYEVAFEASYQNNEGFFALEVYDLPKGICHQILQSDWSMPVATELNEIVVNNGTECNEGIDNKILFAFSNTLGSGDANGGGGAGRPPVDPNNECAQNDTTPLRDRSGTCHSCNESDIINIKDSGDCSVCDGSRGAKRYVAANMDLYGKSCVLAKDCPEGSIPNDQTGYCDCPEGQIVTWWGNKCLPCDQAAQTREGNQVSVLEDNAVNVCAVCGWEATDRDTWGGSYGQRQCIIPESYVPPEVSGVVTVTETESTVTETASSISCAAGYVLYEGWHTDDYHTFFTSECFPECPNGKVMGFLGYCFSCDGEISDIEDRISETCSKCNYNSVSFKDGPGRRSVCCSEGMSSEKDCNACGGTWNPNTYRCSFSVMTNTDTSTVTNPEVSVSVSEEGYFDTDRGDFSCSELAALPPGTRIMVASSTASVSSCPILKTNNIATKYAYIPCPSNAPINHHGTCYSCGESDELSDVEDRCSECPNQYQSGITGRGGEAPDCNLCPSDISTATYASMCTQCGGTWNNGKCSP